MILYAFWSHQRPLSFETHFAFFVFLAVRTVVGENILDLFLAVPTVVGENILKVFLAVRTVVGANILGFR